MVEEPVRQAGLTLPKLVIVPSPYREYFGPLLAYLHQLAAEHPGRCIVLMIPELIQKRWYHFLFPHRMNLLRSLVLLQGGPQFGIVTTPWYPPDMGGSEASAQPPQK